MCSKGTIAFMMEFSTICKPGNVKKRQIKRLLQTRTNVTQYFYPHLFKIHHCRKYKENVVSDNKNHFCSIQSCFYSLSYDHILLQASLP